MPNAANESTRRLGPHECMSTGGCEDHTGGKTCGSKKLGAMVEPTVALVWHLSWHLRGPNETDQSAMPSGKAVWTRSILGIPVRELQATGLVIT